MSRCIAKPCRKGHPSQDVISQHNVSDKKEDKSVSFPLSPKSIRCLRKKPVASKEAAMKGGPSPLLHASFSNSASCDADSSTSVKGKRSISLFLKHPSILLSQAAPPSLDRFRKDAAAVGTSSSASVPMRCDSSPLSDATVRSSRMASPVGVCKVASSERKPDDTSSPPAAGAANASSPGPHSASRLLRLLLFGSDSAPSSPGLEGEHRLEWEGDASPTRRRTRLAEKKERRERGRRPDNEVEVKEHGREQQPAMEEVNENDMELPRGSLATPQSKAEHQKQQLTSHGKANTTPVEEEKTKPLNQEKEHSPFSTIVSVTSTMWPSEKERPLIPESPCWKQEIEKETSENRYHQPGHGRIGMNGYSAVRMRDTSTASTTMWTASTSPCPATISTSFSSCHQTVDRQSVPPSHLNPRMTPGMNERNSFLYPPRPIGFPDAFTVEEEEQPAHHEKREMKKRMALVEERIISSPPVPNTFSLLPPSAPHSTVTPLASEEGKQPEAPEEGEDGEEKQTASLWCASPGIRGGGRAPLAPEEGVVGGAMRVEERATCVPHHDASAGREAKWWNTVGEERVPAPTPTARTTTSTWVSAQLCAAPFFPCTPMVPATCRTPPAFQMSATPLLPSRFSTAPTVATTCVLPSRSSIPGACSALGMEAIPLIKRVGESETHLTVHSHLLQGGPMTTECRCSPADEGISGSSASRKDPIHPSERFACPSPYYGYYECNPYEVYRVPHAAPQYPTEWPLYPLKCATQEGPCCPPPPPRRREKRGGRRGGGKGKKGGGGAAAPTVEKTGKKKGKAGNTSNKKKNARASPLPPYHMRRVDSTEKKESSRKRKGAERRGGNTGAGKEMEAGGSSPSLETTPSSVCSSPPPLLPGGGGGENVTQSPFPLTCGDELGAKVPASHGMVVPFAAGVERSGHTHCTPHVDAKTRSRTPSACTSEGPPVGSSHFSSLPLASSHHDHRVDETKTGEVHELIAETTVEGEEGSGLLTVKEEHHTEEWIEQKGAPTTTEGRDETPSYDAKWKRPTASMEASLVHTGVPSSFASSSVSFGFKVETELAGEKEEKQHVKEEEQVRRHEREEDPLHRSPVPFPLPFHPFCASTSSFPQATKSERTSPLCPSSCSAFHPLEEIPREEMLHGSPLQNVPKHEARRTSLSVPSTPTTTSSPLFDGSTSPMMAAGVSLVDAPSSSSRSSRCGACPDEFTGASGPAGMTSEASCPIPCDEEVSAVSGKGGSGVSPISSVTKTTKRKESEEGEVMQEDEEEPMDRTPPSKRKAPTCLTVCQVLPHSPDALGSATIKSEDGHQATSYEKRVSSRPMDSVEKEPLLSWKTSTIPSEERSKEEVPRSLLGEEGKGGNDGCGQCHGARMWNGATHRSPPQPCEGRQSSSGSSHRMSGVGGESESERLTSVGGSVWRHYDGATLLYRSSTWSGSMASMGAPVPGTISCVPFTPSAPSSSPSLSSSSSFSPAAVRREGKGFPLGASPLAVSDAPLPSHGFAVPPPPHCAHTLCFPRSGGIGCRMGGGGSCRTSTHSSRTSTGPFEDPITTTTTTVHHPSSSSGFSPPPRSITRSYPWTGKEYPTLSDHVSGPSYVYSSFMMGSALTSSRISSPVGVSFTGPPGTASSPSAAPTVVPGLGTPCSTASSPSSSSFSCGFHPGMGISYASFHPEGLPASTIPGNATSLMGSHMEQDSFIGGSSLSPLSLFSPGMTSPRAMTTSSNGPGMTARAPTVMSPTTSGFPAVPCSPKLFFCSAPTAIRVVDQMEDLHHLCCYLVEHPQPISLDLEGRDLGKNGSLCIVTLATIECIFLIDIAVLGPGALDEAPYEEEGGSSSHNSSTHSQQENSWSSDPEHPLTSPSILAPTSSSSSSSTSGTCSRRTTHLLRRVLESPHILKLMFDCRGDCEALYYCYHIRLQNVCDLQAAYCCAFRPSCQLLPSMKAVLSELDLLSSEEKLIKERGREYFSPDKGGSFSAWEDRPLVPLLIHYCAVDVRHFFRAFYLMKDFADSAKAISEERIKRVCSGYVFKKMAVRDF